jgi:hypothetical protein
VERLLHTISQSEAGHIQVPRIAVTFAQPEARGMAVRLTDVLRAEGVCTVVHDGAPAPERALENLARLGYAAAVYIGAGQDGCMVGVFRPALLEGARADSVLVGTHP